MQKVLTEEDLKEVYTKYREKILPLLEEKERYEMEGNTDTEVYKNVREKIEIENAKGVLIVELLECLRGSKKLEEVNKV